VGERLERLLEQAISAGERGVLRAIAFALGGQARQARDAFKDASEVDAAASEARLGQLAPELVGEFGL